MTLYLFASVDFSYSIYFLKSFFSTSVSLTYTKLSSFIHIYILKVFTEGFVHIIYTSFIIALYLLATVDFSYNT